jgi:hypothetical protein
MKSFKTLLARRLPIPSDWVGEKSEFAAAGDSGDVYWIPEQMMNAPGKTTVFNRIQLNQRLRREFPEDLVEYTFLHERGHANQGVAGRISFLISTIGSLSVSVVFFGLALLLVASAVSNPTLPTVGAGISFFGLSSLFGWLFCRARKNEELRAEWYALDRLGEAEFRRRYQLWEEKADRSLWGRLQRRFFYPELETVLAT